MNQKSPKQVCVEKIALYDKPIRADNAFDFVQLNLKLLFFPFLTVDKLSPRYLYDSRYLYINSEIILYHFSVYPTLWTQFNLNRKHSLSIVYPPKNQQNIFLKQWYDAAFIRGISIQYNVVSVYQNFNCNFICWSAIPSLIHLYLINK